MARKKKQPVVVSGGGGWMMTYADLMSLLMAFFVMLLASAEMDKKKFAEMGQSMRLALGSPLTENTKSVSDDFKLFDEQSKKELIEQIEKKKIVDKKVQKTKMDAKRLEKALADRIAKKEVEVITHGRMIIIRLLDEGVFSSGDAKILPEFWSSIQKMKNELQTVDGDIIVSGYTDNIPMRNEKYRSNWELSAARAYSVIAALTGGINMPPDRFVLRGFGETRPLTNNDTAINRAKNRRVELLIDQRDPADKTDETHKDSNIDGKLPDTPLPKELGKIQANPVNSVLPILNS